MTSFSIFLLNAFSKTHVKQINKHPNTAYTLLQSLPHFGADAIRRLVLLPQSILRFSSVQVCECSTTPLSSQDTILYKPGAHSSMCVCVCVLWSIVIHPPTRAPPPTPLFSPQILSPLLCVDMQTNANRVNMFECLHLNEKKQSLILCQNRGVKQKQAKEFPIAVEMLTVL